MKRIVTILLTACIGVFLSTAALANHNVLNTFAKNAVNKTCPADGAKDVGPYDGTQSWCDAYLEQAVLECKAGCVVQKTNCDPAALTINIKRGYSLSSHICPKEIYEHYLPSGVTVASCISEWGDFAHHC